MSTCGHCVRGAYKVQSQVSEHLVDDVQGSAGRRGLPAYKEPCTPKEVHDFLVSDSLLPALSLRFPCPNGCSWLGWMLIL
jgi:hypothetical protein